jgi:hypothetical protein
VEDLEFPPARNFRADVGKCGEEAVKAGGKGVCGTGAREPEGSGAAARPPEGEEGDAEKK